MNFERILREAVDEAVKKVALKMEADILSAMLTGHPPRAQKVTVFRPLQLEAPTIDAEYTIVDDQGNG